MGELRCDPIFLGINYLCIYLKYGYPAILTKGIPKSASVFQKKSKTINNKMAK